jgi:hypothetical protein
MSSKSGVEQKGRCKSLDLLLLILWSLIVAIVGVGLFWVADYMRLSPAWMLGAGSAVILFLAVGWGYRSLFRSQAFIAFFTAWTLVHIAIFLGVLAYLGFLYYLPIVIVELCVGYAIAIWQFGPPPYKAIR